MVGVLLYEKVLYEKEREMSGASRGVREILEGEEGVQSYVKKFDGKKTAMDCQVPKKFGGDGEERRKLTNVEAWWRAKEIVSADRGRVQDGFTDDDWGLVTTIFKNMMGVSDKSEMLELRCKFLDGIEDLGLSSVSDAYELLDEAEGIHFSR